MAYRNDYIKQYAIWPTSCNGYYVKSHFGAFELAPRPEQISLRPPARIVRSKANRPGWVGAGIGFAPSARAFASPSSFAAFS